MNTATSNCSRLLGATRSRDDSLQVIFFSRCILSTDMARHNEILNKFKDILADGFSFENEAHKSMVRLQWVFPSPRGNISRNYFYLSGKKRTDTKGGRFVIQK